MTIMRTLFDADIPGLDDAIENPGLGGPETWHYWVYRIFDWDNRLLYIGCTTDIVTRFQVHSCSWHTPASAWINTFGTRTEIAGPYVGKSVARAIEKAAIGDEAPLLNTLHNRGRSVLRNPETRQAAYAELAASRAAS